MARADVLARTLLAEHGMDAAPVDPMKLAEALGVTVVTTLMADGITGLFVREPERVVVGVNQTLSPRRQRWAVAHGIGHSRFSRGRTRIVDSYDRVHADAPESPTDREEIEANRFATALLLPEHLVRATAQEGRITGPRDLVDRVTEAFAVGSGIAEGRLVQLGILAGPI